MQLTLDPADAVPRSYWITRRQWLELLHALAALPLPSAGDQVAEPPKQEGGRIGPAQDALPATPLQDIRLRKTPTGIRLAFVADPESATLVLQAEGIRRLIQVLQQQSERAGWDPQSALARLQARDLAGATLRKARRPR